jgi:nitroreductase
LNIPGQTGRSPDLEKLLDLMKKRMSIRAYLDKELPEDVVKTLLEAAQHAPTARNLQQLEYKVVTNKDLIRRISDSIRSALKKENRGMQFPERSSFFYGAPLLIIITGPAENTWIYSDAGLAAQNIMLYATSLDLGSCFIGMTRFIDQDPKILKELHIGAGSKFAAAVICGYPAEKPAPKEKKLNAEYFP